MLAGRITRAAAKTHEKYDWFMQNTGQRIFIASLILACLALFHFSRSLYFRLITFII